MQPGHEVLFAPLTVRGHTLRNRIVCPPMVTRRNLVGQDGLAWYRRLAAGGAACVIVEASCTDEFGPVYTAENLASLASAISSEGALPVVQLFLMPRGALQEPADFSSADLDAAAAQFVAAGKLCEQAGFAGVEPHGAHGFLLNRFFSPERNARTEAYGGNSLEGRMKLGLQIVEMLREALSPETLLFYRHTPQSDYPLEDSLTFAHRLQDVGLDVLDLSPSTVESPADLAAPFTAALDVPTIAVGGLAAHHRAVTALSQRRCDLIAIGRGLIADSDWPNKTQAGRLDDLTECVQCDEACFGNLRRGEPIGCTQWE